MTQHYTSCDIINIADLKRDDVCNQLLNSQRPAVVLTGAQLQFIIIRPLEHGKLSLPGKLL